MRTFVTVNNLGYRYTIVYHVDISEHEGNNVYVHVSGFSRFFIDLESD